MFLIRNKMSRDLPSFPTEHTMFKSYPWADGPDIRKETFRNLQAANPYIKGILAAPPKATPQGIRG